jgi:L,D-transpeptidase-like protein
MTKLDRRGLRLRVLCLSSVLSVAFFAASRPGVSGESRAHAVPLPPAAAVATPAAAVPPATAVATVAAAVQPAVATPRTAVFTRGVPGLSPQVLAMALDAVSCARARGVSGRDGRLTVIDYSLSSTRPRLWVLDLAHGEVLFHELVAHGSGSGGEYATRFSNAADSRQTSLGLFLTGDTYQGGNGYSLKLHGLDKGVNDQAEERRVVIHGAWYVSAEHARQYGYLGRSWGCPALSLEHARPVIDAIKGGSFVFAYAGDRSWLQLAANSQHGPSCPSPASTGSSTAAKTAA